jgi:hypothetical protein
VKKLGQEVDWGDEVTAEWTCEPTPEPDPTAEGRPPF